MANDFLNDVFQRDQPLQHSVFVDDQREVLPLGAEFVQLAVDGGGLGNKPRFDQDTDYLLVIQLAVIFTQGPDKRFYMQHTYDVVGLALPERNPAVRAADRMVDNIV